MKCKYCKNQIPDGSIFCNMCGERLIREKKKQKDEIKVPKPVQLPSGSWRIQLKAEGKSVTESTEAKCIAKAKAIRAGFIEDEKNKIEKVILNDAIQDYISSCDSVLSPSTIDGYKKIGRNHFQKYSSKNVVSIDWQKAINEESKKYSPKTVSNAWGLISRVMRYKGVEVPAVKLPAKEQKDLSWLDFEQIQALLEEIRGDSCEIAVLLALHSLRRSELLAITPNKVDEDGIHVDGAIVYTADGLVQKNTNKTGASKRVVPIMIPRLQELFDESEAEPDQPYVSQYFHTVYKHINNACKKAGIPEVGYHGLRRSFASLGYKLGWSERQTMMIGGWSDWRTMHKIYIKLNKSDVDDAAEKMRSLYAGVENE